MTRANEPAYPWECAPGLQGLTIREHFAAMAMQGFLANSQVKWDWNTIAASAVGQADRLIAELAKATP